MAELTKEEKKAKRKVAIKSFLRNAFPYVVTASFVGVEAYLIGKNNGKKEGRTEFVNSPEMKLIKGITAYDAICEFEDASLNVALRDGHCGTRFTNTSTGEVKYLVSTVTEEKPEWWDDNKNCDWADEIADHIAEGK